jgi:hypothetical protein
VLEKDGNLKGLVDASVEYLKTLDENFMCSKKLVEEKIRVFAVREKRGGVVKWYEKNEKWAQQKETEKLIKENAAEEKKKMEEERGKKKLDVEFKVKDVEVKSGRVKDTRTTVLTKEVNYYESD